MDDQNLQDKLVKDLAELCENSGSETDEELASSAAVDGRMYQMLFSDRVQSSVSRSGSVDESDFMADTERSFRSGSSDVTADVTSPSNEPELQEDMQCYCGPAEWRGFWQWEVDDGNHLTSEHDTQQYEDCSESDESVDDGVGSDCADDCGECSAGQFCVVHEPCSAVDKFGDCDSASAEPHSTDTDHTATNDRELAADNIESVFDEVMNSCVDHIVTWDSADESGLTELDKQQDKNADCDIQDFVTTSSQGRHLSRCTPMSESSARHHVSDCVDDDDGLMAAFPASPMFTPRPSYSSSAHGRSVDSKWNLPHTPTAADNDSSRRKPRASWRKNSAGNVTEALYLTKSCMYADVI